MALPNRLIVDEFVHVSQINLILNGDFGHHANITTFIYLHMLYAFLVDLLNLASNLDYRLINLVFISLLVYSIYIVNKTENNEIDLVKALQLFFLPVAFPYYPLIYTDIVALMLILFSVHHLQKQQHIIAATIACLAVLVRQPSLLWLALMATMIFFGDSNYRNKFQLKNCYAAILTSAPYSIAILGFVGYFFLNKGIALGDKQAHTIQLNLTNFYFMVLVSFMVFLPLFLSRLKASYNMVKNHIWILLLVCIGLPIYIYSFEVNHPYNAASLNAFIRNLLLNSINDNLVYKIITYFLVCYSLVVVSTIKLKDKKWLWLYVFLPLSVVAMPLIEHRYYIVGLALWQIYRVRQNDRIEFIQLLWTTSLSIGLYLCVTQGILNL
ncbi:MAG: hypothetical protein L3J52_06805 [Proteobacteria bacterium]|nr:hypothetical protein [Pseudomonadota bacterium]